jgi:hypothetical protein
VSKRLAELWGSTSTADREEYDSMASLGKSEYQVKKTAWEEECQAITGKSESSGSKRGASKTGQSKSKANPIDAPKRPRSAYIYFCAAKRAEASEKAGTLGEISKEIARMWVETEDRGEYQALAQVDKTRYEQEKMIYEGTGGTALVSSNRKQKVTAKSSSSTTRNGSSVNTPSSLPKTPRAPSAYMLFCREYRPTMLDQDGQKLPLGETTKRLASLWKECDEDARAKFQRQAAEEKELLLSPSHHS